MRRGRDRSVAQAKVKKKKKKWKQLAVENKVKDNMTDRTGRDAPLHILLEQNWTCTLKTNKPKKSQRCTRSKSQSWIPPPTSPSLFMEHRPTDAHVHRRTHGLMQAHIAAHCWRSNEILVNNLVLSSCSNPHLLACYFKVSWVTVLSKITLAVWIWTVHSSKTLNTF